MRLAGQKWLARRMGAGCGWFGLFALFVWFAVVLTWLQQQIGVHGVVRVKRLLDLAHQTQCHWRVVARQGLALELAYAVLGADAAAKAVYGIEYQAVNGAFVRG